MIVIIVMGSGGNVWKTKIPILLKFVLEALLFSFAITHSSTSHMCLLIEKKKISDKHIILPTVKKTDFRKLAFNGLILI